MHLIILKSRNATQQSDYVNKVAFRDSSRDDWIEKCYGNLGARLTNVGFIWLLVDLG